MLSQLPFTAACDLHSNSHLSLNPVGQSPKGLIGVRSYSQTCLHDMGFCFSRGFLLVLWKGKQNYSTSSH